MVTKPASYSGAPGFKSQPGERQSWLRFLLVFLSPFKQTPGQHAYLKLVHYYFQILSNLLPILSLDATDSVVE
jgi:hypothetical protein